MAYTRRRTTRRTTRYTARRPARRRATSPRRQNRKRNGGQRVVIQIVGLPAGSQVSTATLGKKSGRPVRARF